MVAMKEIIKTDDDSSLILVLHASVGSGHKSAANAIAKALELIKAESRELDSDLEIELVEPSVAHLTKSAESAAKDDTASRNTTDKASALDAPNDAAPAKGLAPEAADKDTKARQLAQRDAAENLGFDRKQFDLAKNIEVEVLDILDFGRIVFNGDNTASMFTGATRPFYDITWRYTFTGRFLWGGGTIWARIMYPKFVEYVKQKKPKALVCTHITAANVAVSARMLLGATFPIICVPTDYEVEGLWPHMYTDLFCVANEYMAETLRPRKVPENRIQITGIPASPDFSRTYDKDEMRKRFDLPEGKQIVLFLAGASLPRPYVHFRNSIDQIMPYMHTYTNMHMVIVAGKDAEYADALRRKVGEYGLKNITVLEYVDGMAGLMAASDLVVCKSGGLTVTEILCIGVPMILLGKAYGQEKANVSMLTASGAALHVTTARELVGLLHQINDHPQITRSTIINAEFIRRPDAAMDIAKATLRLICEKKDATSKFYRKHFMRFYWGKKPAHVR